LQYTALQDNATKRNCGAKQENIVSYPTITIPPPNNSAILTIATIIKTLLSSAAEAELGALYSNPKEAAYSRQILTKMGHPQPRTPIQTDNLTAEGVINHNIHSKQTKAMDMHFHWLRNCEAQGQFFEFTGNP
jgi:hypothetical protein